MEEGSKGPRRVGNTYGLTFDFKGSILFLKVKCMYFVVVLFFITVVGEVITGGDLAVATFYLLISL